MKIYLNATRGPLKGKTYEFSEYNRISVGRSEKTYFSLPNDARISRLHCLIEMLEQGRIFVKDLGSSNGTYRGIYNSQNQKVVFRRIEESEVKNNEYIAIGQTVFKVAIEIDNDLTISYDNGRSQEINHSESKINNKIGDFEVIKEIGKGGMGAVYLVKYETDTNNKLLALKILYPHMVPQEKQIKRFLRECEYGSKIRHENLVKYYQSGYSNSGFFYVPMEFIDGKTLDHFPIMAVENFQKRAFDIIEGLSYLHKKNIVHRDIKPKNIMIPNDSKYAKIIDFGLAKNFEESGLSVLTLSNKFIGTPAFSPPEQIYNARDVGIASDIYSLGATFYYMLTKRKVFSGSINEILMKVIYQKPNLPSDFNPNIPKNLEKTIVSCLEKNTENRPNLNEIKEAIAQL